MSIENSTDLVARYDMFHRLAGSSRTRWGTAHVEGQRRGERHDLVDIAGMMGWMLILQEFHR